MTDEVVPKRRPTDPKPGTKGPPRGSNDAFLQKMPKAPAPEPSPPPPYEGPLAKYRKQGIEDQLKKATAYKKGGLVRGWGKARR